ncbi:MAG: hypothetical protein ACLP50_36435 [Solirubrobacteraceae bacterium]
MSRVSVSRLLLTSAICAVFAAIPSAAMAAGPLTSLHYAPGRNLRTKHHVTTYAPGADGFNLADVSSAGEIEYLPAGVNALAYIGLCGGVESAFLSDVTPYIGKPRVYGFYIVDEPDPTGKYEPICLASNLKAEADWIDLNLPGAKTFIVLMNLGTPTAPEYTDVYDSANTDIELFGLDPYPCRKEFKGCNYAVISDGVAAAEAEGYPERQLIPVYQAFGGGGYKSWTLPTAAQEEEILATWGVLVPAPAFDYAYAWGRQDKDKSLERSKPLQAVFAAHNAG